MKKICILSAVNIKHMSLISLYTEKLIKDNIYFDIIYMDKYGEEEAFCSQNKYVFKNIIDKKLHPIVKVIKYFKFKKFAINVLEKNKYDFIIVWNDLAIFIFARYLSKKWKNKYCLNIRDYCAQDKWPFKNRYKRVIKSSAFATISSDGYNKFLPSYPYIHVHSLNTQILKEEFKRKDINITTPIKITFVGNIRFYDINKKIINLFGNDNRFELHYYGTNAKLLYEYAEQNGINNLIFKDSFPIEDTNKYIKNSDIINNIYGSNKKSLDYALSIKLYHGVYNYIPLLVNEGTYMAEIIKKYNIGFIVKELNETTKEDIYNWYTNIKFEDFKINADRFMEKIIKDNTEFEKKYLTHIGKNM